MEQKTVKSMNLALLRPTERLYVLIPKELDTLLRERSQETNAKIGTLVRVALAEYLTK